jgi:hypothetical protein
MTYAGAGAEATACGPVIMMTASLADMSTSTTAVLSLLADGRIKSATNQAEED